MILRASPAALCTMTNLAPFLAASLRLGARLNEAETCAKPYRFTPCLFELARTRHAGIEGAGRREGGRDGRSAGASRDEDSNLEGQSTAGVITEASMVPPNPEMVTVTFSPALMRLMLTPCATL